MNRSGPIRVAYLIAEDRGMLHNHKDSHVPHGYRVNDEYGLSNPIPNEMQALHIAYRSIPCEVLKIIHVIEKDK